MVDEQAARRQVTHYINARLKEVKNLLPSPEDFEDCKKLIRRLQHYKLKCIEAQVSNPPNHDKAHTMCANASKIEEKLNENIERLWPSAEDCNGPEEEYPLDSDDDEGSSQED